MALQFLGFLFELILQKGYANGRLTIIGATSLAQLRENVDAYFLDALPDDCEAAVADIYRRYRDPSKT